MSTEVLTYSRSKGAFAGLTLEGAVVERTMTPLALFTAKIWSSATFCRAR